MGRLYCECVTWRRTLEEFIVVEITLYLMRFCVQPVHQYPSCSINAQLIYLTEGILHSSVLQIVGGSEKRWLWVGIGGSEKNQLWYVANGMSDKQRYSKCSK